MITKSGEEELNARHGVKAVHGDSGGTLNSVPLHAGLLNDQIYPFFAGCRG